MESQLLSKVNYDPSLLYNQLFKGIGDWKELIQEYIEDDIVMQYYQNENYRFDDILLVKGLIKFKEPCISLIDKFPKIKDRLGQVELEDQLVDIEIIDIMKRSALKTYKDFQIGNQSDIFEESQILQILEHVQILHINPSILQGILEQNIQYCLLENFSKEKLEQIIKNNIKNQQNLEEKQLDNKIDKIIQTFFLYNLIQKLNIILKQNTIQIFENFKQQIQQVYKLPLVYEHIYNQKSFTIYKEGDKLKLVFSNNLKENITYISINKPKDRIDRFLYIDHSKMKQNLIEHRPNKIIIVANEDIKLTELRSLYDQLRQYQKVYLFDLKIAKDEIIDQLHNICDTFTSKQNFYNMYFCNPIDITILKYEKNMLKNIKIPIDEDFLDFLLSNYLKYKFLERGIVFDYLKSMDYQKILNKIIGQKELKQIMQINIQNLQKSEIQSNDHQYFYFYKILNKNSKLNLIKYNQNEIQNIKEIDEYLQKVDQSYTTYLFEGMISDVFYKQASQNHLHFFIEMVKKINQNNVYNENKLKMQIARIFLDLYQNNFQSLQQDVQSKYLQNEFFLKLLEQQNLKIHNHKVIKIKIIQIQDHFVKGYYKDTYAVYLSQKDCGLKKIFKMQDYYSKNEYIYGNAIKVDENYLEIDIAQNLQDKQKVIQDFQKYVYKKYKLQDYQYVITPKNIKLIVRPFLQKRNFDFLDIQHKKFYNKSVQIIKQKLVKDQTHDKICYFFAPSDRTQKYKLQAKLYIKDTEQFVTVPIFHDNKQRENFDGNIINLTHDEDMQDKEEYYYINKFEKFREFSKFAEYFENVSQKIYEVSKDKNFYYCIETGDNDIEFRFESKCYFHLQVIYKKDKDKYISEIQLGTKYYFKDEIFENLQNIKRFIEKNNDNFKDEIYTPKVLDLQMFSEYGNQIEMISNMNSNDTNSLYKGNTSQRNQKNSWNFQKQNNRQTSKHTTSKSRNQFNRNQKQTLSSIKQNSQSSKQSKRSNKSSNSRKSNNNSSRSISYNKRNKKNQQIIQDDFGSRQNQGRNRRQTSWNQNQNPRQQNKWKEKSGNNESVQNDHNQNNRRKNNGWGNKKNNEQKNQKTVGWGNQKNKSNKWQKNHENETEQNNEIQSPTHSFNEQTRHREKSGWQKQSKTDNQKNPQKRGWQQNQQQKKKDRSSWQKSQGNSYMQDKNREIPQEDDNKSVDEEKNLKNQRCRRQPSWAASKRSESKGKTKNVIWQSKSNIKSQFAEIKEEQKDNSLLEKKSQI